MPISVEGHFSAGFGALDYSIDSLLFVDTGGVLTLFSGSGRNGGLASFELSTPGDATLVDHVLFDGAWSLGLSDPFFHMDGQLFIGALDTGQISAYSISTEGEIGTLSHYAGLATGTARFAALAETSTGFAAADVHGQTSIFVQDAAGDVISESNLSGPDAQPLGHITSLAAVVVDGHEILLAGDATNDRLLSYTLDETGAPLASISDAAMGMMNPTDIAVTEVLGQSFAVVGSAEGMSGALSVLRIGADGSLTGTDQLADSLDTRFGQVQEVEAVAVDGRTYVVAGGADGGLSLFVLLPDGRLQYLESIENSWTDGSPGQAALAHISALAATEFEGAIRIVAASETQAGLTELSYDVSTQGEMRLAQAGGETLMGGTRDDILVGGAGDDVISGGSGADILVDGAGTDALTGGAGSDIFVFRNDGRDDYVMDFDPTLDHLDFSSWPFFYHPDALDVSSTATGAIVHFRDETLTLRAMDGQSLTVAEVKSAVLAMPHRALDTSGYDFPVATEEEEADPIPEPDPGQAGPDEDTMGADPDVDSDEGGQDNQTDPDTAQTDEEDAGFLPETEQQIDYDPNDPAHVDRVNGGRRADMIDGGTGNDVLSGRGGNDALYGGADDDVLRGGAGRDRLWGETGNDRLDGGGGNDRLYGGDGGDILTGKNGRDQLFGDTGNDILNGGGGRDRLDGGDGADVLLGKGGNDVLIGGYGWDQIRGDGGHDRIEPGGGGDTVWGGRGRDTFIFRSGDGDDRIMDYGRLDKLRLVGIDESDVTLTRSGGDTVIEWGSDSITLENFDAGWFGIDDIKFD